MGVHTHTQEIKCSVPAKRMFKAMGGGTESYNVLPKIIPNVFKSIEILHGDGGPGTIRKAHFADGFPFPYGKHKVDYLDAENKESKYTLIEGTVIGGDLESVFYHQKYEDTPDGGCVIKTVREWRTKGDQLKEEVIKAEEDSYVSTTKHVEDYLIAHPEVCAA